MSKFVTIVGMVAFLLVVMACGAPVTPASPTSAPAAATNAPSTQAAAPATVAAAPATSVSTLAAAPRATAVPATMAATAAAPATMAATAAAAPATMAATAAVAPATMAATAAVATSADSLSGTSWTLATLGGNPPAAGTTVTLGFLPKSIAAGSDGCNSFSTTYSVTADSLKFGPVAGTMMACSPDTTMTQATAFQTALGQTAKYTMTAELLTLMDTSGKTLATFGPQKAGLEGTGWILATLDGNAPAAGTTVTLAFLPKSIAAGTDGCNNFTTTYTQDGDSLKFGPVAGTMMACSPESTMKQAASYTAALAQTAKFTMTPALLTLIDAGGKTLMTFNAQKTGLAGTSWDVTGFNNGKQAVVSVINGTTLTLVFGTDGTLSGSAGCNTFSGAYQSDDKSTIKIGPLASTRKLCATPEGIMEQETQYMASLESASTYSIRGSTLEFRTAADAMAATFIAAK